MLIKAGEEEYFLQHHALVRRTVKKNENYAIKNVSDSEGRVDFAIRLMNSDLPYGKVKLFFENSKISEEL